jgi:hypothetical protein
MRIAIHLLLLGSLTIVLGHAGCALDQPSLSQDAQAADAAVDGAAAQPEDPQPAFARERPDVRRQGLPAERAVAGGTLETTSRAAVRDRDQGAPMAQLPTKVATAFQAQLQPAAVGPSEPAPVPADRAPVDNGPEEVDTDTHCDPEYAEEAPPVVPPGVERCGEDVVCVPPAADPLAACEAALALLYLPGSSCLPPQALTTASEGALRGAALFEVSQPDMVESYAVALASERGYDRVLAFFSESLSVNMDSKTEFTTFALAQLVKGGPLELHVESKTSYEWSYCTEEGGGEGEHTDFAMCGIDGRGKSYCLARVRRSHMTRDYAWDEQAEARTYHNLVKFALDVQVEGGALVVKRKAGRVGKGLRPLLGRHSIARARKLLDRAYQQGF